MSDDEPDVENYYWKLHRFVRMVARGESNALLVEADPGLGKSYQITHTLADEIGLSGPSAVRKVGGHSSPLELYHSLFEAKNGGVVFLDDLEGVIDNRTALSLLKQATWSEGDRRTVEWRSSSEKVEIEQFEFSGRIIMCFNDTSDNKLVESLKDRTLYYRLHFDYDERIGLIHEVAKADHKNLSYDERAECADWIERNTEKGSRPNLRTLIHVMDCRAHEPDRWQRLASEFVQIDEELALVNQLIEEYGTSEEAAEAYTAETGKSRRTFFRRKKGIG